MFIILFILFSLLFISPKSGDVRSAYHSSQLEKEIIPDGNTERTDYVDNNGRITIAADLGYASKVVTYSDKFETEQYFDDQGKPISRYLGYYGLLREYDNTGKVIRIKYLDNDGNPVEMWYGYAIEEYEYNEEGHIQITRYYDTEGFPVSTSAYGFGRINEYDANHKVIRIVFIDESGMPMMTKQGCAIIRRNYYRSGESDSGRVESELYFNEKDIPISLSLGQYGVHKEYDEFGREIVLTYLDAEGKPTKTNKGYTTIKRTYQTDNTIATERYFDLDGKPFAMPDGQYGIKKENGQVIYLDENGSETFSIRRLLYNHSWIVVLLALFVVMLSALTGRKQNVVFLILYIATIVYMTLLFRESGAMPFSVFLRYYKRIFADSNARADIIKNIWLFIPLGAVLYRMRPKVTIIFIPIILSILIEGIQLITKTGTCELDDIISNSLGGLIGFYMGKLAEDIKLRMGGQKTIHSV